MQPDPGNVVNVWNTLARKALHQGFEYFMVLGDDIQLPQGNWLEVFVKRWSARYLGETGAQERRSRVRGRGYMA
eukprot:COSAG02_NODE_25499_length_657_cov_0.915771_1_plen_73_part_10